MEGSVKDMKPTQIRMMVQSIQTMMKMTGMSLDDFFEQLPAPLPENAKEKNTKTHRNTH